MGQRMVGKGRVTPDQATAEQEKAADAEERAGSRPPELKARQTKLDEARRAIDQKKASSK